ncbi:MAG: YciI family protein, partial [Candidatus Limnocylindrales bacterium]
MLLIYTQEPEQTEARGASAGEASGTAPGEAPEIPPAWTEYTDWLLKSGMHSAGEQLAGSTAATTVRVRDGNRLVTDGPFTETKEVLGGYYIVDCDNLDDALEAAAR